MSLVLPEGIDSLIDCPFTLQEGILAALQFLRWREEYPPDEQPPRRIWLDPERLKAHWEAVDAARDEKYGRDKTEPEDEVTETNAVELIKRG